MDRLSVCRILLLQRNVNWAAQNPPLDRMRSEGRGLDMAALDLYLLSILQFTTKFYKISPAGATIPISFRDNPNTAPESRQ